MSIRLIRVLTRFGAGGPPIHCLIATRELAKLHYDTTLIVGRCGPADGDMNYLARPDDRLLRLNSLTPHTSLLEDFRTLFFLWRHFRREQPHIVHTHTAKAGAIGRLAAWLAGVPVIVHTYHGHVLRGYFSPSKSWLMLQAERLLARLSDTLCVLAPQQARELGSDFQVAAPHKIRVIPLGLDLEQWRALPDPPPHAPTTIGWVGRLVPIKNVPLLIEVIDQVLAERPSVRFLIAGDGSERTVLESALPRWRGRVEWLGWVRDVAPMIERCHILAQTSLSEGTPVSLIQGMAARRPFVSTAVGGVPDMAGEGRNGILCRPRSGDIAQALIQLLDNPRARQSMGLNASAFVFDTFSQDRLLANLDALYRELLARRVPAVAEARAVESV